MRAVPSTVTRAARRAGWAVLYLALAAAPAAAAGEELSPEEARGRQIYHTGTSPSGEAITVTLGGQDYPLPAEALPCVGCHGPDGRGRPEGGATPSDITWPALTRPYQVTRPSGRRHPPYDRRTLIRAITLGVDPAGNPLQVAMPRFRLTREDAAALAAYIHRLGEERDPGLGPGVVRLGTLLPAAGPLAELGRAAEAVLRARFAEVNAEGGVYGRVLKLRAAPSLAELAADGPVFALVAPLTPGAEEELAAAARERGLPVVGPLIQAPPDAAPPWDRTFYLLSGVAQQARVLWDFAAGRRPSGLEAIVVWSGEAATAPAVAALRDQARRWRRPEPEVLTYHPGSFDPAALAGRLADADAVFFLGPGRDAARLLGVWQTAETQGQPDLFLPGPLAGPLAGPGVFLSFPTLPTDLTPAARARWREFAARHRLPAAYPASQHLVAAAADLLVAALRQAGRALSRDALVAALEGTYGFETGLAPRLTYGPNRRIGALGAYVVEVDAETGELVRTGGWIEPR